MIVTVTLTGGLLADTSTATDGVNTVPVPTRTEQGGILAAPRIVAALAALGYEPNPSYFAALHPEDDPDRAVLDVRPVEH